MTQEQAYLCKTLGPVLALLVACPFVFNLSLASIALAFVVSFILMYWIGCNTYHRYWAHRQFKMRRWVEYLTVYLGLFSLVGDPINYSRTHRQHHACADTWMDPHSPMHGKWHAFMGWMFSTNRYKVGAMWVKDMLRPEYKYLQWVATHQVKIIWYSLFTLGLVSASAVYGVLLAMTLSFVLEMSVNVWGHDAVEGGALDKRVLAWACLASYHSQHHEKPHTAHPGDPGALVIKLLERL